MAEIVPRKRRDFWRTWALLQSHYLLGKNPPGGTLDSYIEGLLLTHVAYYNMEKRKTDTYSFPASRTVLKPEDEKKEP